MTHYSEFYEVEHPTGSHGLCIQHNETFNGTVQDIREVEEGAKAKGYDNEEQWLIIRVEIVAEYGDDGVFQKRTRTETAVGLYDNGQVIRY